MVQTPVKALTLEEFLQLPDTKPASEYMAGQITQKPMPQGKHSTLQGEFVSTVNFTAKRQQIAIAFPELRCTFGGRSIVPDVSVFTWNPIPVDGNGEIANVFALAPDWTIEILSPDQNQTKVTRNISHCLDHGCQMGWLLDPSAQMVIAYPAEQRSRTFSEAGDVLPVPTFMADFSLTLGELWGWLKMPTQPSA